MLFAECNHLSKASLFTEADRWQAHRMLHGMPYYGVFSCEVSGPVSEQRCRDDSEKVLKSGKGRIYIKEVILNNLL